MLISLLTCPDLLLALIARPVKLDRVLLSLPAFDVDSEPDCTHQQIRVVHAGVKNGKIAVDVALIEFIFLGLIVVGQVELIAP